MAMDVIDSCHGNGCFYEPVFELLQTVRGMVVLMWSLVRMTGRGGGREGGRRGQASPGEPQHYQGDVSCALVLLPTSSTPEKGGEMVCNDD